MWSGVSVSAKAASDAPAERTTGKMAPERKDKQPMIDLNPPRGTRDFPPEDLRMRQWLFGKFAEACSPSAHNPRSGSHRELPCSHCLIFLAQMAAAGLSRVLKLAFVSNL